MSWIYFSRNDCAEQRSLQPYLLPIQQFSRSTIWIHLHPFGIHLVWQSGLLVIWFPSNDPPSTTRGFLQERIVSKRRLGRSVEAESGRGLLSLLFVPSFLRLRCYQCRFKGSFWRCTFFVWALFSDTFISFVTETSSWSDVYRGYEGEIFKATMFLVLCNRLVSIAPWALNGLGVPNDPVGERARMINLPWDGFGSLKELQEASYDCQYNYG